MVIGMILIDDASICLMKFLWFKAASVWFSKLFNFMRSVSAGVIFTSIEVGDILKFIRDKVMYRVQIKRVSNGRALAIGYQQLFLPDLSSYVRKSFIDEFGLDLPSEIRANYEKVRHDTLQTLMNEVSKKKSYERLPKTKIEDIMSNYLES